MIKDIKVLVVEDDVKMGMLIQTYLESMEFSDIVVMDSGKKALEYVKAQKVGLIISDLTMPDMSGLDLLKEIRKLPESRMLPFVMLTGSDQKADIHDATLSGVTAYLLKPLKLNAFQDRLKAIFKSLE